MEGKEKEEAKRRMLNKIKLKETEQEISQEDVKRQEAYNMSPRTRGGGGPAGMVKSSSVRRCLCAPTTHPGSFRCRYHRRNAGLGMSRGISVPSNLSMLGGGVGGSNSNLSMLGGGGGGSNSNLSMLAGGGGGGSNSNSSSPKT